MSSNDNGNVTAADEEGREPTPVADMTPEEVEAEGLNVFCQEDLSRTVIGI